MQDNAKTEALKAENAQLRKTNKELRQRLTRQGQVDRNKLVREIAEYVSQHNYSVSGMILEEFTVHES